jgi:hypothetical protein
MQRDPYHWVLSVSGNVYPPPLPESSGTTFGHLTTLELSIKALPLLAWADFPALESLTIADNEVILALAEMADEVTLDSFPALGAMTVRSPRAAISGLLECANFDPDFITEYRRYRRDLDERGIGLRLELCLPANPPSSMALPALLDHLATDIAHLTLVVAPEKEPCRSFSLPVHLPHIELLTLQSSGESQPASTPYGADAPCVQLFALLSSIRSPCLRSLQLDLSYNAWDVATLDGLSKHVVAGSWFPSLQEMIGTIRLDGRTCQDAHTSHRLKAACTKSSVDSTALLIIDSGTEEILA